MSFALSLSGLIAASRALDVIGNNIANSETVGFKTSKLRFADAYAASQAGIEAQTTGTAGVSAEIVNQQFAQGGLAQGSGDLDMAIRGLGFFRLDNNGEITYTRDGRFQLDYLNSTQAGRLLLVNRTGAHVTGYPASYATDAQGTIDTAAAPTSIAVPVDMPAAATTSVRMGVNLDARMPAPTLSPFDPDNAFTYNGTASATVFDADGGKHDLRIYFARQATGVNDWQVYTAMDGGTPTGPAIFSFGPDGLPASIAPLTVTASVAGGQTLSFGLDLSQSTQYGNNFNVGGVIQDGYERGGLDGSSQFSVKDDGVIWTRYSNGQWRRVGQVVLANFRNPDSLLSIGNNQWVRDFDPALGSGNEILDVPGGAQGMGGIQGNAIELSNVELSNELVALIEQQRNYQASAQTFKILDQVLQNLANIR